MCSFYFSASSSFPLTTNSHRLRRDAHWTLRRCESIAVRALKCESRTSDNLSMGKEQSSSTVAAAVAHEEFKLVGFKNFVRKNPKSDRFSVRHFHHIEFWCGDATNTARRFSWGLGMPLVAKSELSTGNSVHASYLLRSGQLNFLFTAPYSPSLSNPSSAAIPTFSFSDHSSFTSSHGLAVRAVAILVDSAFSAYSTALSGGAKSSSPPVLLSDNKTAIAEVHLYGDVVLRFVSYGDGEEASSDGYFLPGFEQIENESSYQQLDYGIRRLDHAVGNVPELGPAVEYLKNLTGFHEFAEFTAEDVGTTESGLNSVVLANNDETVLLPLNEPVYGTKRKSQIQTYLEHNEGAGVQHLALTSEDIIRTLKEMRQRSSVGGFEFMPSPPPTYYRNVKNRAGDVLTDEQIAECERLGILVDRDDQGTLLQIFTKPVGDRPTIFIEIIQRIGCMLKDEKGNAYQKGGCGGFGKGNFSELFKSIEEYEKMLEAKQAVAAS
ncbi:4-hydroxyphenylpyruvate dioxygenase [Andrographis paniculata]|uniref:4-hydroxyphenylpyruvate dioxygenase n=1 Tax=Andrographis paniculata TaxID=175694 RepID=UPI0021E8B543|nr:4-hydroxyphenylpyruvate dioxygenase [Andrographis paniculata]